MILLDENFPESQRQLLRSWRIACRQIGDEVSEPGTHDEDILRLLHHQSRPTFLTHDAGFYHRHLCHQAYGLAVLDAVPYDEMALFARRFLRHPLFRTTGQRLGKVTRITRTGVTYWTAHARFEETTAWPQQPGP